ncbi:hypothetical protein BHM03_00044525, partial [Ensete ventricosum]
MLPPPLPPRCRYRLAVAVFAAVTALAREPALVAWITSSSLLPLAAVAVAATPLAV